jgi:hypothetical protein
MSPVSAPLTRTAGTLHSLPPYLVLALVLAGAAVFAIGGAPSAVADSTNRVAVCSSDEVSGAEVDNCVPNPNTTNGNESSGIYPQFQQSWVLGVGG